MHVTFVRATAALAVAATALLVAAPARGQSDEDRATARTLGEEGYAALERDEHGRAAELFRKADALWHAPTLTLGLARANVGLGRLVTAHEIYVRIVREELPAGAPAAFRRAAEEARQELDDLARALPGVILEVSPATAQVTLDGAQVPSAAFGVRRYVDPGSHQVAAVAPGHVAGSARFSVEKGATVRLALRLEPVAPEAPRVAVTPPPSWHPPVGFAGLGVGVAGAALAVSGLVMASSIDQRQGLHGFTGVAFGVSALGLAAGSFALATAPAGAFSPSGSSAGAALLGVGGAGVALGAVLGGLALDLDSELAVTCPKTQCPTTAIPTLDSYDRTRNLGLVGLLAGGAALAAGAVVLLVPSPGKKAPSPPTPAAGARLLLHVGPAAVGIQGSF